MTSKQLLKLIKSNRDLILRNNAHALEHLQMLKNDYAHLMDEEVTLNLELNSTLAEFHFNSNYHLAIDNSVAVIDKFKKTTHKNVLAMHLKAVGHCYVHTGDFELAEWYLLEALKNISPSDPDYINNKSATLLALAMNEDYREGKYEKAIEYLNEAIDIQKDEKYAVGRASCLMGIGNIYNSIENAEEALKHYLLAVDTFERHYILPSMANAYSNIGNSFIKLKNYEEAEKFLNKSLELRTKLGTPDDISISYFNMAVVHKEKKDFNLAEDFLLKSKKILEEVGNKPYINLVNEMLDDLVHLRKAIQAV